MTIKKITTGKYKGKWQVRIQPVNSITKKRINVSPQYTSTKREAIKLEHKMWNEYNSGFDFEISKNLIVMLISKLKMGIGVTIQLKHGTILTEFLSNILKM